MTNKYYAFILVSILLLSSCAKKEKNQIAQNIVKDSIQVFKPNWESIKKNYKDPEWFNNQKFGIFIHWGVYSVPAFGSEWYPRNMYMDKNKLSATLRVERKGATKEYLHHKKTYGDQSKFGKQVGGDIISNKKTFLLIYALKNAKGDMSTELTQWLDQIDFEPAEKVASVKKIYDSLDVKQATEEKMNQYFQEAFDLLDQIEVMEEAKLPLKLLTEELINREK